MQEQLNEQWKAAMRSGDTLRRDTLSGLRAEIKNAQINARTGAGDVVFDDEQTQGVIEREAKKRRDAIEEYEKADRPDRAQAEQAELEILGEFLPQQLSDEELESIARETQTAAGYSSMKDMGAFMKTLKPLVAGRADGKRVNEVVKRLLAG